MTLTCNKKAHSILRDQCKTCSEKEECFNKGKSVFVGMAEMPKTEMSSTELVNPILRDSSTVTIRINTDSSFDVLKSDITKRINDRFNFSINTFGG